jgi:putative transposase
MWLSALAFLHSLYEWVMVRPPINPMLRSKNYWTQNAKFLNSKCGENHETHQIKTIRGCKALRKIVVRPSSISSNQLNREHTVERPDHYWVRILPIPELGKGGYIQPLLMAVWRRRPKQRVVIQSDQGSQYGTDDWIRFCKNHNLEPSMGRRGNCWGNAVAESFLAV